MSIRKQQVVRICLDTFVKKGLAHTSTRDLCEALNLNSGGVFWYFKTKDDIVIACAEEASLIVQNDLLDAVLQNMYDSDKLWSIVHERSVEMRPVMKFFASVCASSKYNEAMQPILDRVSDRYRDYTRRFAEKLSVTEEEVAPYVYTFINTMLSFMLFGREGFVAPQLGLVNDKLIDILEKKRQKEQKDPKGA